jgi:putative ABC transport system permease protein
VTSRFILKLVALFVPADRREEWMEEWVAELDALAEMGREGRAGGYPGLMSFVVGSVPHALWLRMEGWTMESVGQDLRFAVRILRRTPGFTVVAAVTLALGIGANAGIFSLVNGLMLRPPAGIEDPDGLVQIARSYDEAPRWDNWSYPAAELIRDASPLLSELAGYSNGSFVLGRGDDTEPVGGQYVTGSYFGALGVRPLLGRLIGPEDDLTPGAHPVAVLSHGLWMRRFGGSSEVIGTVLPVGSFPYEIIGVAPGEFAGIDALGSSPEMWVPSMQRARSNGGSLHDQWGSSWIYLFGRLREGTAYEAAKASMDAVTMRLREASDLNEDIRVLMASGVGLSPEERTEGEQVVFLLSGIAALVLLLTCANVGNLFLTRATARVGELSLRQALGAGRGRLVRQLVTESVVLGLVATVVAVPIVNGVSRVIPSIFPFPMTVSVAPDVRVYLFLLIVGVAAGVLFSAVPAWSVARHDVSKVLREAGTTGGRSRTRLRDALVVGQLAVSLGLMSGSALLGRSIMNAQSADPGFNPDGVLVGSLNLSSTGRFDETTAVEFQSRLLDELKGMPGVISVAIANQAPILGGHSRATVRPADRLDDPSAGFEAEYITVTPGYFETLEIPVVRGRTIREPAQEPEPVVVVNESLANLFWPGLDPLGQEVGGRDQPRRVVGVVADVQMRSLRNPGMPAVYYPYHQEPELFLTVHVKVQGVTTARTPALRNAVANVDPEVPLLSVADLRDGLGRSLAETRTFGLLVSVFAGLAAVLSFIGLYGLISHGVSQRAREMGIRIALGAAAGVITRLVLARGVMLAAIGIGLGLGVSLILGRALESVLFGVDPSSPWTFGAAALLLFAASMAAAWVPARRATRVDAAVSLRD